MRVYSLISVFIFFSYFLVAQNNLIKDELAKPKSIPAPIWANELLKDNPNIFTLDSAYEAYFKVVPFKKDDWTKYYRRWRKRIEPFLMPNGFLMDSKLYDQYRTQIEKKTNFAKEQSASWKNIGPVSTHWLTQDVPTGNECPWQVNIYALEVAPSDPNILYIATETSSFFRSSDKGKTWELKGESYMLSSEALAIHPTDPNTVILGSDGVVRKSTDGGQTWTNIYTNSGLWCYRIAFHPTDPNIIIIASNKGLFRTTNGGIAWNQIISNNCSDMEFHPTNPNIVYVLKQNTATDFYECWKSTNAGANFSAKTSGWPTGLTEGEGRLAVTPADATRVYAVLLTNSGPRILRSNNSGETWTLTASGSTTALEMNNGQGYYDLDIVASTIDANKIIVATTTAFLSSDGGTNFTAVGGYYGPFPVHPDIQAMRSIGNDTYIATDGGLTYSNDFFDSNSESRSKGIFATDLWGFDSGWNEDVLVGGRYHNGNTAWFEQYPEGEFLRMGGAEAATGYVNPIKNRQTFFSDIGGYEIPVNKTGKLVNLPISKWPNESYYYMEFSEMAWDPTCWNHVYIGNGASVMKSTNNGVSFSTLFTSSDQDAVIEHIEVSRSNPKVIYATQRSNSLGDGKIWRTSDGGKTWNALPILPTTAGQRRVMNISISAENENELWVALAYSSNGKKVYYTPNSGNTWINWTSNKLDNLNLTYIIHQMGTNGGVYVAAANGRVFYRNKSMSDWDDFSTGLPVNHYSRGMKPFYRDNKIRSGSNIGFWETNLFETSKLLAQPCADKLVTACSRDTFYFDDYSVLNYDGAQNWFWEFPGAQTVIGANTRNPKVVYETSGEFDVKLTISNSTGSNTKTIQKMLVVLPSECGIDTIPGNCLKMSGDKKIISIPAIKDLQNAKEISVMCWIRLSDKQEWFTQLVSNWSSNAGFGFGFAFQGYVPTVNLTFSWKNVPYWLTSPFNLELNKWIHVAMTVEPTKVTLYKDGIPWVYNGDFTNFDLSSTPFEIGGPVYGQGGTFNGEMEEFKIYKKALSQAEIREQMHLINKQPDDGLVLYYQFNESVPDLVYDKIAQSHGLNGSGQLVVSNAVVATGVSDRVSVTTTGTTDFPKSGVKLKFSTSGGTNLPNGELVVSRLFTTPFGKPVTSGSISSHYWVLENWGTNQNFSGLSELTFLNSGIESTSAKLFGRQVYEFNSNIWGYNAATGTAVNGGQPGDLQILNLSVVKSSAQIVLAGKKIPVKANAGKDIAICEGDQTILFGSGGIKYDWYDESGAFIGTQQQISVSPKQSTFYVLNVTDVNGNQGVDTVNVMVNSLPDAYAGVDTSVCLGNTIQLEGSGGVTYLWSPSNLLNNANLINPIANVSSNTTFVVEVIGMNGCKATDTVKVTVNPKPEIILLDINIKAGEDAKTSIPGNYQIVWSNGNLGPDFSTPIGGKYSVTVTNMDGCSQEITFNVLLDSTSLPNIYLVQPSLLGLQQIVKSDAYQWYLDNQLIGGATNQTIVPPANGFYTTYVHYENGFETITPPYYYDKTSTDESYGVILNYSPNPVKHRIQLSFENPKGVDLSKLKCKMFDNQGRIVYSTNIDESQTIDVSNLPAGMYYFKLENERLKLTGSIQVVR